MCIKNNNSNSKFLNPLSYFSFWHTLSFFHLQTQVHHHRTFNYLLGQHYFIIQTHYEHFIRIYLSKTFLGYILHNINFFLWNEKENDIDFFFCIVTFSWLLNTVPPKSYYFNACKHISRVFLCHCHHSK